MSTPIHIYMSIYKLCIHMIPWAHEPMGLMDPIWGNGPMGPMGVKGPGPWGPWPNDTHGSIGPM